MTKAKGATLPPPTAEQLRGVLDFIPPDLGHDDRVRVGFALYDGLGDAGEELFLAWAGARSKPDAAEDKATWRSCRKPGKTKVATLFGMAKDHGYKPPAGAAVVPKVSAEERQRQAEKKRQEQAAEEAQLAQRREDAAQRCQKLWEGAKTEAGRAGCPYLARKGVKAYGLRFLPGGTALVPMRDEAGKLWSVQRLLPKAKVDPETGKAGSDKFYGPLKTAPDEVLSSRKLGLWHLLGEASHAVPVLLLGEGYATCATLHEATGLPVAVCFDAGNLVHVAKALRQLHPAALLLVCGDDDAATEARKGKNPGRQAAAAAVQAAGAPAAAVFPTALPEGGKDFNDLGQASGLAVVRQQIEQALAQALGSVADDAAGADAPAAGSPGRPEGPRKPPTARGEPEDLPERASDPDAWGFFTDEKGVWHVSHGRDGNRLRPVLICGPLWVTATTHNEQGNGFGYLLEFINIRGVRRSWAAPSAMFNGDSGEWAARLRDMGLFMAYGTAPRNLVGKYINSRQPSEYVTCVDKVGWRGPVYVLPNRCIGTDAARKYIFQSEGLVEDLFRQQGGLTEWKARIGAKCAGNTRLVFSVCCALTGPTMTLGRLATGGLHWIGASSLGKTTALQVAASVWGPPSFKQQWRATDNGAEGLAVAHNDCTLILDEISQMDGRMIGEVVYMYSNERMKVRNSSKILLRKHMEWRMLFLSSGEKSLADHMLQAGKKPNEGQLLRMPSVPADAGAGLGIFECLHDLTTPKALAEYLDRLCSEVYGSPGLAWLQWLSKNLDYFAENWAQDRADLVEKMAPGMHPQVQRVATRFAQVGLAGELATKVGITGWQPGEAEGAATACFQAWLKTRGHAGSGEEAEGVRLVRSLIEAHGDGRFTWTERALDSHNPKTINRLGFKRLVDEQGKPIKVTAADEYSDKRTPEEWQSIYGALVEYLILPEQFKAEVAKAGLSPDGVARVLKARGHLKHEPDRLTIKHRVPGIGMSSFYHLKPSILTDEL